MTTSVKRLYEAMFLVDAADASSQWDQVMQAVENTMKRADAEVISARKWDERRLCYEVNGRKRGTYILVYCKCPPENVARIERDVQLHELLLRVLILCAEHMTEEDMNKPTPAMQAPEERPESDEDSSSRPVPAGAPASRSAEAYTPRPTPPSPAPPAESQPQLTPPATAAPASEATTPASPETAPASETTPAPAEEQEKTES